MSATMSTECLGWKKTRTPSSIVPSCDRRTTGCVVFLQAAYRGQKTRDRVVRPALIAFRQIHEEISSGCHDNLTIEELCGPMKLPSCLFGDQCATAGIAAAASVPGPGDLASIGSLRKSSCDSRMGACANVGANPAEKARRAGDVPHTEAHIDHASDAGKHTGPSTDLVTCPSSHNVGFVPPASAAAPELAVVANADGGAAAAPDAVIAVAPATAATAATAPSAANWRRGAVNTAEQEVNGEKSKGEEKEEREEVEEDMDHPRAAEGENPVEIDGDATEHFPRGSTGCVIEASIEDSVGEPLPGYQQQSPGSNGGEQQAYADRRAPSCAERGARRQVEHVSENVRSVNSASTVEVDDKMPWKDESPTADCFTYSDGDEDGDDEFVGRMPAKDGNIDSALVMQNSDAPSGPIHLDSGTYEVETGSAAQHSRGHGGRVPAGRSQESHQLPLTPVSEGIRTATTRTRQDEDDRGGSAASDDKSTASPDGDASAVADDARWTGAVEDELNCDGPASIGGGDTDRKVEREGGERCRSSQAGERSALRQTATRDRRRGGREENREEEERNERRMESARDGRENRADLLADAFAACSSPARDVPGPPGRKQGQNKTPGSSLAWSLASSFEASPLKGESIFASSLAVENDPPDLRVRDPGAGDRHRPADANTAVSGEAVSALPASRGRPHRQESPRENTASITEWSSLELEQELDRIREAVASRVLYLRSIMREPGPAAH